MWSCTSFTVTTIRIPRPLASTPSGRTLRSSRETRVVADGREATVRLDLKAIRNRTEPDLYLKPDDHIIIGTNFWAFPLAVLRNGLRATYGYGFILDRNFGNDVFGAPPGSFGTQ